MSIELTKMIWTKADIEYVLDLLGKRGQIAIARALWVGNGEICKVNRHRFELLGTSRQPWLAECEEIAKQLKSGELSKADVLELGISEMKYKKIVTKFELDYDSSKCEQTDECPIFERDPSPMIVQSWFSYQHPVKYWEGEHVNRS